MKRSVLKSLSMILVAVLFIGVVGGCSCSKKKENNPKETPSILGVYTFSGVETSSQVVVNSCDILGSEYAPIKVTCEMYETASFELQDNGILLIKNIGEQKTDGLKFYKVENGIIYVRDSGNLEWGDGYGLLVDGHLKIEMLDGIYFVFKK